MSETPIPPLLKLLDVPLKRQFAPAPKRPRFRILKKAHKEDRYGAEVRPLFLPQKRVFRFFWVTMGTYRSIEAAQEAINECRALRSVEVVATYD